MPNTKTKTTAVDDGRLEELPIGKLKPSALNPRKTFDKDSMAELIASVKIHGVVTPILVRPNGKEFEIAAGERRHRAAKAAKLKTLPAIVRSMDDKQFIEIVTIENLQREDLHPMEEAYGYSRLLASGYDTQGIADKIGKSQTYVQRRVKLLELSEPARKLFEANTITPAHAVILARLSNEEQAEALDPNAEILYHWHSRDVVSVRDLRHNVRNRLYLKLEKVPWNLKDAKLVPEAGACAMCPKRTGNAPALFEDIEEADVCTDRQCFDSKLDAVVARAVADPNTVVISTVREAKALPAGVFKQNEWAYAFDSQCPTQARAVYFDGHSKGRREKVCIDLKACPVHGGTGQSRGSQSEKNRERQGRIESKVRAELIETIHEGKWTAEGERDFLRWTARRWIRERMPSDALAALGKLYGFEPEKVRGGYGQTCEAAFLRLIDGSTVLELQKLIYEAELIKMRKPAMWDSKPNAGFDALLRELGVDPTPVRREHAAEARRRDRRRRDAKTKKKSAKQAS